MSPRASQSPSGKPSLPRKVKSKSKSKEKGRIPADVGKVVEKSVKGKKAHLGVDMPIKKVANETKGKQIPNIKAGSINGGDKTASTVGKGEKVPLVNKFSLKDGERPAVRSKRRKTGREKEIAAHPHNVHSRSGKDNRMTPDVLFHKQMTKEKLALLERSPLSKLISQHDKDAAAEEVFGKGAKFATAGKTREQTPKDEEVEDDEIILLDTTAAPPKKRVKTPHPPAEPKDPATLLAEKRETRRLRRKVRKLRARGQLPTSEPMDTDLGVMYLGHIPHGFYEKEIHAYFSQYGHVTRVRLSRSKKTARSRGFAFVEFADKEVALVAAKSMDGYLMHGQKLVAKLMEPERVHPDTFKGANRVFRRIPFAAIERRALIKRARDPLKLAQRSKAVQKNLNKKKIKLAKKGILYQFPQIPQISPTTTE